MKTPKESVWLEYEADTPPQSIVKGYETQESECVATLLRGIPDEGGSATKPIFEMLVRMAFQGGLAAIQSAAFAAGERKGRIAGLREAMALVGHPTAYRQLSDIADRLEREEEGK